MRMRNAATEPLRTAQWELPAICKHRSGTTPLFQNTILALSKNAANEAFVSTLDSARVARAMRAKMADRQ